MSRQRYIHPEIWRSGDFTVLSTPAKLLFIALFSLADDDGRGGASPRVLSGCVFPGDGLDVSPMLAEIAARGMVILYDFDGNPYYALKNWARYQKPKYPRPSKIPAPPRHKSSRKTSSSLPQTSLVGRVGLGEDRRESSSPVVSVSLHRKRARATLSGFDLFWLAYPRKASKGDAEKAWAALAPDGALQSEIGRAVAEQRGWIEWNRDGGKYIPYPASWLRAKGWENRRPEALPAGLFTDKTVHNRQMAKLFIENGERRESRRPTQIHPGPDDDR